jgi:hypothetical protein
MKNNKLRKLTAYSQVLNGSLLGGGVDVFLCLEEHPKPEQAYPQLVQNCAHWIQKSADTVHQMPEGICNSAYIPHRLHIGNGPHSASRACMRGADREILPSDLSNQNMVQLLSLNTRTGDVWQCHAEVQVLACVQHSSITQMHLLIHMFYKSSVHSVDAKDTMNGIECGAKRCWDLCNQQW